MSVTMALHEDMISLIIIGLIIIFVAALLNHSEWPLRFPLPEEFRHYMSVFPNLPKGSKGLCTPESSDAECPKCEYLDTES